MKLPKSAPEKSTNGNGVKGNQGLWFFFEGLSSSTLFQE
jgi:hypothetical protein